MLWLIFFERVSSGLWGGRWDAESGTIIRLDLIYAEYVTSLVSDAPIGTARREAQHMVEVTRKLLKELGPTLNDLKTQHMLFEPYYLLPGAPENKTATPCPILPGGRTGLHFASL